MSSALPLPASNPPFVPGLELQEKIGEGSTGVVYRAVHRTLQRAVAVKVLRGATSPNGPDWLREPRLMAALAHPHVVAVHDAGQADGQNYLVMEYMDGGSLRTRMEPGRPWPLARATAVLDQVAAALERIHGQGVLHLDLKPENVLYAANGVVKITDFGLSAASADPRATAGDGRPSGTLDYSPPESLAGLPPDPRYDVFSLATIAYELLTARAPGRVYVPASRRNPELPAAVDEVLRRGLARDPEQRYASAAAFREALAAVGRPRRSRVRGRVAIAVAATAVVAGLLVAGGWQKRTRTDDSSPVAERPPQLTVLYDDPDDLTLLAGEDGGELSGGPDAVVERVRVETPPQSIPPGLPLSVWPTPRPVLVVNSPGAWGFVYPLQDRALGERVVKHWAALLRAVVAPGKNLVSAGGFDGDCLATNHRGKLWRVGDVSDWNDARRITLEAPADRPGDPALVLTGTDPVRGTKLLGTYQPLGRPFGSGEVVVLRYRARARDGTERLAVYAGMPVALTDGDKGPGAGRVRRFGNALPPEPGYPKADRWQYRCPTWVTPASDWQTYVVVVESPPVPTQALHRNLVIDLAGTGRAWVDDVELFVWQPGGTP